MKTENLIDHTCHEFQPETIAALERVPAGTVCADAQNFGLINGEPLILGLDGLLRYAKAYRNAYEQPLAQDGVLGQAWLSAIKGYRRLLDGDGAVAMECGRTTDSKDNGACLAVLSAALKAAGFEEGKDF